MGGVGGDAVLLAAGGPDCVVELQPLEEDLPRPEAEAGTDLEGGTASTEQATLRHAGSGYTGQGGVKVKTLSAGSWRIFFIKIFQQFLQWLFFDPFLILLEILKPSSL